MEGELMKLIAGPCQHESYELSNEIATECKKICEAHGFDYIFKASFDKANRTNNIGKRGIGDTMWERINSFIDDMGKMDKFKKTTDIHEPWQAVELAKAVSVLQIPAFLSRQTDLIKAACETGRIVSIKKGQFMAPWDLRGVVSKCEKAEELWLVERGTSFGYNNLVVDYAAMQKNIEYYDRVQQFFDDGKYVMSHFFFDATHSVQKIGSLGGHSRDYVRGMAKAAAAVGCKNFFFEVHPNPIASPSDKHNTVALKDFPAIVEDIAKIIKLI